MTKNLRYIHEFSFQPRNFGFSHMSPEAIAIKLQTHYKHHDLRKLDLNEMIFNFYYQCDYIKFIR